MELMGDGHELGIFRSQKDDHRRLGIVGQGVEGGEVGEVEV